jgi:hypothetical protein
MSSKEFHEKFEVSRSIGDGLCLFHTIARLRRKDYRPSYGRRERDEFLARYRQHFKGRREEHTFMRLASDKEWDDMERRVEFPDPDSGYPNELAIIMAQEVFDIILYVWADFTAALWSYLGAESAHCSHQSAVYWSYVELYGPAALRSTPAEVGICRSHRSYQAVTAWKCTSSSSVSYL